MRTAPDSLEAELLRLPARERARMAELLIASLDEEAEADVDEAWAAEAERRLAELRAGTVSAIPAEEVHARVERRLRRAREQAE